MLDALCSLVNVCLCVLFRMRPCDILPRSYRLSRFFYFTFIDSINLLIAMFLSL